MVVERQVFWFPTFLLHVSIGHLLQESTFPALLSIYQYGLVDSCFIQWVLFPTIPIYVDAQITQIWSIRAPSFWPFLGVLLVVWALPYSLAQDVSDPSCPFSATSLEPALLQEALVHFSGEWCLEAKTWELGVFTAAMNVIASKPTRNWGMQVRVWIDVKTPIPIYLYISAYIH